MEIKTISASSYNCFQTCPLAWKYQYVMKLIQPESDALFIGKIYHKAVELFHSSHKLEEVIEIIKKEMLQGSNEKAIENFSLVRKMIELYSKNPITKKTIKTEYRFSIPLPGITPKLYGFIDRIVEGGIVEYKTSSFDYEEKDYCGIQTDIYSYAYFKEFNHIPTVTYHVTNKKKLKDGNYKPQIIEIQKSESDLKKLEEKCLEFYNKIKEGQFIATPGNHCHWCFYKDVCNKK